MALYKFRIIIIISSSSNPCTYNYMDYGCGDHYMADQSSYGWLVVGQSAGAGLVYAL